MHTHRHILKSKNHERVTPILNTVELKNVYFYFSTQFINCQNVNNKELTVVYR